MVFVSYVIRAVEVLWIGLYHLVALTWDVLWKRPGPRGPERLRMALEQMSGSFLKFGQILSLQVDTLPRAYCDALLDLLDRVPPFAEREVRRIFNEDLGRLPEECFKEFDYKVIAAASIGQVHIAYLSDGTKVAVKVQRPGIREVFTRDAVLLNGFVKLIFLLRLKTLYFMRDPAREFNEWIQEELDYRTEAHYAGLLERNARSTPSEKIPRIHWELTTERILTMDFLEGQSVRDYLRSREMGNLEKLSRLEELGFVPSEFVSNVIRNFVSDALKFGAFHADLHPANLLILRDNRVGYVDFGIVGYLTPEARRKIIQMTLGYVRGQNDEIFSAFMAVSEITPHADLPGFRKELERLSRRWYLEPTIAGNPKFGTSITLLMIDLLTLCRNYGVLPRRELIKYIRSLFLADGLVSRLAPGLDYGPHLRELCEEYIMEAAQERLTSNRQFLPLLADLAGWFQTGPGGMLRAFDLMDRRELPIRVNLADPVPSDRIGHRAFWAAVGWLFSGGTLALHWEAVRTAPSDPSSIVAVAFFSVFTAWLLQILWKLTR